MRVHEINIATELFDLLLFDITVHARDGRDKYRLKLHKNNEFDKRYKLQVDNKVYSEWDH